MAAALVATAAPTAEAKAATGPTSCTGATVGMNTDLHGYRFFPDGHPLNTPIDSLTKNTYSDAWKKTCAGGNGTIRPDYSMPYNVAPASTPGVTATALQYNGTPYDNPWLIPADATLEGGPYTAGADGDHHCLVLSLADCQSYETYQHLWGDSGHTTFLRRVRHHLEHRGHWQRDEQRRRCGRSPHLADHHPRR